MQPLPPSVTVYSGGVSLFRNVMAQTLAPVTYRPQVPHAKLHVIFGITQMVVGGLCFVLDIVTVCLKTDYVRFGVGIYSGIIFYITGLLGYLAGRNNSTCCVVACTVMNVIACCVATIGISFAFIQLSSYRNDSKFSYSLFIRYKAIFIFLACLFESIFTIIHSSLACENGCLSCLPRDMVPEPRQVIATTVRTAQPVQQQVYHPRQQAQQHYPRQVQPQHYPPQMQSHQYPPQMRSPQYPPQMQPQQYQQPPVTGYTPSPPQDGGPAYPQASANLPFNPAFGPYEAVESKQPL